MSSLPECQFCWSFYNVNLQFCVDICVLGCSRSFNLACVSFYGPFGCPELECFYSIFEQPCSLVLLLCRELVVVQWLPGTCRCFKGRGQQANSIIKWNWTFHFSSPESYIGLQGLTRIDQNCHFSSKQHQIDRANNMIMIQPNSRDPNRLLYIFS